MLLLLFICKEIVVFFVAFCTAIDASVVCLCTDIVVFFVDFCTNIAASVVCLLAFAQISFTFLLHFCFQIASFRALFCVQRLLLLMLTSLRLKYLSVQNFTLHNTYCTLYSVRRRIKTEEKAKVVASVGGKNLINSLPR